MTRLYCTTASSKQILQKDQTQSKWPSSLQQATIQYLSMVEPSFTRCHQNHDSQHLTTMLLLYSVLASALNSKPVIALIPRLCIRPGDEMMEPSNHEETDTRIVIHIIDALPNVNSILIRTGDIDVFIILLGQFSRFHSINPNLNLWNAFSGEKHQEMLNINRLHQSIGPERCLTLSMFHAMSGCDTTSGMKSKGKHIWWNTWNKHPEVTETCEDIIVPLPGFVRCDFTSVEDFVCRLYDNTSTTSEVNVLRMNMFCQRSQDVQRIPPTQDALILHLRRAVYQASIW